jgi:tripartite-type tricarboxylate transporter receptor subunit TctC
MRIVPAFPAFLLAAFVAASAAAAENATLTVSQYPAKTIRIVLPLSPDIPTIAEAGVPGYAADAWYGLLAPRGTPPAIVAKLSTTLASSLATPAVREKLLAQGVETAGGTPEQFRGLMKRETRQWAKVIREAGIRAE